ncbi:MAG: CBS domain-containing protein [Anaerolineaceae bacterium]
MANKQRNIVICPSCGAENIEGADSCDHCTADLGSVDVPESTQMDTDSDLALPISSVRFEKPQTVPLSATVREAVEAMLRGMTGAVVVLDSGRIVGILTERDVLKRIAGKGELMAEPVSAYMTKDPVTLRHTDPMAHALNKMGVGGFRHIPVTRDGELVGIATARDVMAWVMGKYFG